METPRIVVLTGAGVSAESGISTFRDANGLWKSRRLESIASPNAYLSTPDLVHEFYDARREQARSALPNAAHYALADLARDLNHAAGRCGVMIVTQNVDALHERAGSEKVVHLHGRLDSALCTHCRARTDWENELIGRPPCPACGVAALRPDIVWFGESVHGIDDVHAAVGTCELLIVVGTSGNVWPAAGLAARAHASGAETILVNKEPWADMSHFDRFIEGPATVEVPVLVGEILDRDFDPEEDWTEVSPDMLRMSIYIDVETTLIDNPLGFERLDDPSTVLPGLRPGARDAVRQLSSDFNVVLVVSDEVAKSSGFDRFWDWYTTRFGSYKGQIVDQLLIAGDRQSMRGWDFLVEGDDTCDGTASWVGEVVTLGPKHIPDWPEAVDHIRNRAWELIGARNGRRHASESDPQLMRDAELCE